jgi:molybdopterin/thiamine biosynthesis adenylyltransferase
MMDNSRLAYLGGGLQRLRRSTVSVVGAGGGGSHLIQQLAHVAVGTLPVIDADIVEGSNVNRVVCSNYGVVGRHKALVLADRLRGLGGQIVPVLARAESPKGRAWIERSDLVLGAVDGVRARHNIEAICRAALVPYIDIGLKVCLGDDGEVIGIGGQVFVSQPGRACMHCVSIVTEEGMLRDREEYAVGDPDQQVVSLNGLLASQAVDTAISLLTAFAPHFPPRLLVRYDGLLHRMLPDPDAERVTCPHYPLSETGWGVVLPKGPNPA